MIAIRKSFALAAGLVLLGCASPPAQPPSPVAIDLLDVERENWSWRGTPGVFLRTSGWDIRTTVPHARLVDLLPTFYDHALMRYATALTPLPWPRHRLQVYLMRDEKQWSAKLREMLGSDAAEWQALGRGGVTIDGTALLYDLDGRGRSRATLRIAAHEGWHQYAEAALVDCLPTWLDEGIATWMEGFRVSSNGVEFLPFRNWDRRAALRSAMTADVIAPLEDLLAAEPGGVLRDGRSSLLAYYAQLWALTTYITEHEVYSLQLDRVLQAAATGRLADLVGPYPTPLDWLMFFDADPLALEAGYRTWIDELTAPGRWSH